MHASNHDHSVGRCMSEMLYLRNTKPGREGVSVP